jgi:predicted transglutaminase-like cysteine proteinase
MVGLSTVRGLPRLCGHQASRPACARLAVAIAASLRGRHCVREHHLVLIVRTKDVDLVLDNLNANVRVTRYQ